VKSFAYLFALAFTLVLGSGSAHADSEFGFQEGHWMCQSVGSETTFYFSDVFDANALSGEVANAFSQALAAKYGVKTRISCSVAYMSGSTVAGLQAGRKTQAAQLRQSGKTVVETGWVFVPANVRLPYLCSGFVTVQKAGEPTNYLYLTQVLQMPGSVLDKLEGQWRDYLKGLHPGFYYNPQGCNLLSPDPTAQEAMLGSMTDQFKAQNPQIVHVDWTWAPGQQAAADQGDAFYCQALSADGKSWYVSSVQPVVGTWDWVAARKSWADYVFHTLKLQPSVYGRVGCDEGPAKNEEDARAARKEQIEGLAGSHIFEADWKYVPGQAHALSPSIPPAPGSNSQAQGTAAASNAPVQNQPATFYVCQFNMKSSTGQLVYYSTDAFPSTTSFVDLNKAWSSYAAASFHLPNPTLAHCTRVAAPDAQQPSPFNVLKQALAASHIEVIEVNWKG
jgi:hypothetical protein